MDQCVGIEVGVNLEFTQRLLHKDVYSLIPRGKETVPHIELLRGKVKPNSEKVILNHLIEFVASLSHQSYQLTYEQSEKNTYGHLKDLERLCFELREILISTLSDSNLLISSNPMEPGRMSVKIRRENKTFPFLDEERIMMRPTRVYCLPGPSRALRYPVQVS
jgi:hypothetical protein